MKTKFLKNTIIIIITSLLIKLLGLVNKIILTRSLKEQGIALYSLVLPTIMLFISISSFSLNTAMIKVSAKYKSKKIIFPSINIGLITTSISSIVLLLLLKTLTSELLKQPSSYYPILFSIPLLYLTTISSILRGYLTGIEKMAITSIANLLEQLMRIIFTILIFIFIKNDSLIVYVVLTIIAMSIGEAFSIIYSTYNIKKINNENNNYKNDKIYHEILEIAVPTTLTSLVSNITFFLEPIIFTFVLTKQNISSNDILLNYSKITTYSLPLITLFSFIPMAIATVIMPKMSTSSDKYIKEVIFKILVLCLIPAILISTILSNFSSEITSFLYATTTGADIVKKYTWFFIIFYLIPPINTILLSTNESKKVFKISLIVHIVKLISLFVLPFYSKDSLIISYFISYFLIFIFEIIALYHKYHFNFSINNIIILLLFTIIINCFTKIILTININFIIQIIIISFTYLLLIYRFVKRNYV